MVDISYDLKYSYIMVTITAVRHAYPENGGFKIARPNGHKDYTFLHFFTCMDITLGTKTFRTRPDACIVYDKTTPQFFSSETPVVHDWMHFSCTEEKTDLAGVPLNCVFYPVNGSFITYIAQELEREFFGDLPDRDKMLAAKFDELMIKLKRSVNDKTKPLAAETAAALEELRQKMFSDLSKNYTVEELARSVSFSPSYFFSLYKDLFGISPVSDLILSKINAAKNMLAFTDAPVLKIARQLGYGNVTHFLRQFKSRVGVSPSTYRSAAKAK